MSAAAEAPSAAIYGCRGPALSAWERDFFRDADPFGFCLFKRNCRSTDQVRALTDALREAVGRADVPVLVDQEGGRVQRFKPPHWPKDPPAAAFGRLAERDPDMAEQAAGALASAIAQDLAAAGVTGNAVPVLDLAFPSASDVIGDRAYGTDPALVIRLGQAVADAHLRAGVMPIVKHLPGHGRAQVDSHRALPTVDAELDTLRLTDFVPFRALRDLPWGMTAHIVYSNIDSARPATVSPVVIGEVIRREIGFVGLLYSDDLSMGALSGAIGDRAVRALEAGCDIALHCNGQPDEMMAMAAAVPRLTPAAQARIARGEAVRRAAQAQAGPADPPDVLRARVDALLQGA